MDKRSYILYLLQLSAFRYLSRYFGWFKPEKYYLLNQFYIAGYQFYDGDKILNDLNIGDELHISAEPKNEHDKNAVCLSYKDFKIGYAPKVDNKLLSELLINDVSIHCVVTEIRPDMDPWERLFVQVFLEGNTFIAS